jgi:hypothetical protein
MALGALKQWAQWSHYPNLFSHLATVATDIWKLCIVLLLQPITNLEKFIASKFLFACPSTPWDWKTMWLHCCQKQQISTSASLEWERTGRGVSMATTLLWACPSLCSLTVIHPAERPLDLCHQCIDLEGGWFFWDDFTYSTQTLWYRVSQRVLGSLRTPHLFYRMRNCNINWLTSDLRFVR